MTEDHAIANHPPRLNEPAPDFEVRTTRGTRRLADYHGRWLVLFSHPGDFTPVCTTEFLAFWMASESFAAENCELLGLSVDSVYSHLAWLRNIHDKFGVEIPFPVVEDPSLRVARAYGMIHPGASETSTVRATFVIDPEGILRALLYYPMTTGRSVKEILRLVRALKTADEHQVATPAGWNPGDQVIVPPPVTDVEARNRSDSRDYDCTDWYFCKKDL